MMAVCIYCKRDKASSEFFPGPGKYHEWCSRTCKECATALVQTAPQHYARVQPFVEIYTFLDDPRVVVGAKICPHCLAPKALDEFAPKLRGRDRRAKHCMRCVRDMANERQRAYNTRQRERIALWKAAYDRTVDGEQWLGASGRWLVV